MKIITGKTATEHVNSEDDRGLHAGIFGSGSYVLNTGTKLQASIVSSTTIRISSGDLVHQGCHARIPYNEYDEVTIDAGTTGYNRVDIIVARYEKRAGIESMSLVAIKGQPSSSTPVSPSYNNGNILAGDSISDMPLYKVTLAGVNIESVESLFIVWNKNNTIGEYIYPVGSIYISVNKVNPATLFGGTWEQIKDRFLLAYGDTYNNGATGGEATHTLTSQEMPTHNHTYDKSASSTDNHTLTTNEIPSHTHSVTGTAKDHIGRSILVGPSRAWAGAGDMEEYTYVGSDNDELDVDGTAQATGGGQGHNHTINISNTNTGSTGGGNAHNNMPPYLAVNIWKRTA